MPRISVVMPMYNAAPFLFASINSILNQSYTDFELLILDDASTDNSLDIAEQFRDPRIVIVRNQDKKGLVDLLNIGIKMASGELVARQDADDISFPNRFLKQVSFLENNPEVGLLGSQYLLLSEYGTPVGIGRYKSEDHISNIWAMCFGNNFVHTSIMLKIRVIIDCGTYDPAFHLVEDYDLWTRICRKYKVANLPEYLVCYRMRPSLFQRHEDKTFRYLHGSVAKKNLLAIFPSAQFTDYELHLIENFRYFLTQDEANEFLLLFLKLIKMHIATNPKSSLENFSKTIRQQMDMAICYGCDRSLLDSVWKSVCNTLNSL